MKIVVNAAFLRSENLGGSFTYTHRLLRGLAKMQRGDTIVVLCTREMAERLAVPGVVPRPVEIPAGSKIARVFVEQNIVPRVVKELGPDIVHSTGNVIPLATTVPSVVTLHDLQFRHYPEYFGLSRRLYLGKVIPRSLRKASAVVYISESTKRDAESTYPIPRGIRRVIHEGGIDDNDREWAASKADLHGRYGISRPYILSVGSALPHKNLPLLVEAFARIANAVAHDLVLAGEPFGHGDRLAALIGQTLGGAKDRIRSLGFVPRRDLIGLYQQADGFVFPSLFEGFGIPLVEAMQSGCPVIASDIAVHKEIAGDAARFFDPHDEVSLARALTDVCLSPEVRRGMKDRGIERGTKFSWDSMASETRALYEDVLMAARDDSAARQRWQGKR